MADVKAFIIQYAVVHGLPQPAAPRGHNTAAPTYLSCVTTKKLVHALYAEAGGKVAYSTFMRLWADLCKEVIIMKPKEDVCGVCSDRQSRISRARTEEDRRKFTDALREHMI